MSKRFLHFIESIKAKFYKNKLIDQPAKFEQRLRKLMTDKNFDDNKMSVLIDVNELMKLDCDIKAYFYNFSKTYIETKSKILNEQAIDSENIIIE